MRDRMSAWVTVLFLVLAVVALPRPLHAQAQTTSTLTGTITDSSGAVLPGVTVAISSPSLIGGTYSTVTDNQGIYRFLSLQPGLYKLTADLQGFRPSLNENIRIQLGQTVTLDVKMALASLAETVAVSAQSSMVDVKSSAASVQIDNELLQNLPTERFQPDVINLAPGITNSVAYGGTASSNALMIDGVDVSDPDGGSPWSFFNYNWIQEVQVVGLGANAEYRRVHRRRRQQHRPLRREPVLGTVRVPDRAQRLDQRQHRGACPRRCAQTSSRARSTRIGTRRHSSAVRS